MEIVKVQLPLHSNEEKPKALVYTEGHETEFLLDVTDDLLEMMDGVAKAFFEVDFTDGRCNILRRVEDQPW